MATLADIEKTLASAGLAYKPGVGGLLVGAVDDGFLVYSVNPACEPVRFQREQIASLLDAFPKLPRAELERTLVRNNETARRAIQLEQRTQSPFYSHFTSLDDTRPMPAPGTVDGRVAKNIPRMYFALDLSDAERPAIALWGSELALRADKLRLDESMFVADISKEQADMVRKGAKLEDVMAKAPVKNVRVLYYDDNRAIGGAERVQHHSKSIATASAWIKHVVATTRMQISGSLFLHIEDHFVDPQALSIEGDSGKAVRPNPSQGKPVRPGQRFFLAMTLTPKIKDGQWLDLVPAPRSTTRLFIEGMGRKDMKAVLANLRTARKQLVAALAKL